MSRCCWTLCAIAGSTREPAVWDDADVDWGSFELVVVRSAWDYAPRRDQFVAWARTLPRVLNPAEVITWNTDKRYLGEMQRRGRHDVRRARASLGSAGRRVRGQAGDLGGARSTPPDTAPSDADRARQHVSATVGRRAHVMVQPYLERGRRASARPRCCTSAGSTRTRSARGRCCSPAGARGDRALRRGGRSVRAIPAPPSARRRSRCWTRCHGRVASCCTRGWT